MEEVCTILQCKTFSVFIWVSIHSWLSTSSVLAFNTLYGLCHSVSSVLLEYKVVFLSLCIYFNMQKIDEMHSDVCVIISVHILFFLCLSRTIFISLLFLPSQILHFHMYPIVPVGCPIFMWIFWHRLFETEMSLEINVALCTAKLWAD